MCIFLTTKGTKETQELMGSFKGHKVHVAYAYFCDISLTTKDTKKIQKGLWTLLKGTRSM